MLFHFLGMESHWIKRNIFFFFKEKENKVIILTLGRFSYSSISVFTGELFCFHHLFSFERYISKDLSFNYLLWW